MSSVFGGDQSKPSFATGSGNLFGSTPAQPNSFAIATPTKSSFGLFAPNAASGSTTPLSSPSKPANPPAESSSGSSSTPNIFGAPPSSNSSSSIFTSAPGDATQNSSNTLAPSTSINTVSLFAPAPTTSGSGQTASPWGAKPSPDSAVPATSSATNLFGAPAPTSAPSTNLFGAPASQQPSKPVAEAAPSSADTKTPFNAGSGGLFGSKITSTAPKQPSPLGTVDKDESTVTPSSQSNAPTTATATAVAKPAVGLAPPSLLRGKTMEDLVTRWASELDERTGEFKHMADEIAAWDQGLIQNGDQISNLYNELQRIEPVHSSIDQTLDYVESQQAELSAALDEYERQLSAHLPAQQDLAALSGARPRTAAQEREQAYRLAEDVHVQLNDMTTSLGAMIAEINTLSGPRTSSAEEGVVATTPAEDDPIVQVGGILNAHLSSLNWIGDITQDLSSKLGELEQRVSNTKVEFGLETRLNDLAVADDHLPSSRRSITSSISSPYRSTPRR